MKSSLLTQSTLLVLATALLSSCGVDKTYSLNAEMAAQEQRASANKAKADAVKLPFLVEREVTSTANLVRTLELKPQKTYEDFIDLGLVYLTKGEDIKAAEAYDAAAQLGDTTGKVAGALYNKVIPLAYAGKMHEALSTADLVVQLSPTNTEAAWLRYSMYQHSGDQLGLLVAADHLAGLEPDTTGHEVAAVTAMIVTGVVSAIAMASVVTVAVVALTPPNDRKEVAVPLMAGYYETVGSGIGVMAKGVPQKTLGRSMARSMAK